MPPALRGLPGRPDQMNIKKSRAHKPQPIVLGPLPVLQINQAMQLELVPGDLIVPVGIEIHISRQRPGEYARLLPHLGAVTANPLYVGDDFKNEGIELVGSAPGSGGAFILVAICLEIDSTGRYQVRTFYATSREKIERRRQKGVLWNIL